MEENKSNKTTGKIKKPLNEGDILKNNYDKPNPNIKKEAVLKPPAAKPKE
jgi:hypothetical protein